jgi:hypothetical protein
MDPSRGCDSCGKAGVACIKPDESLEARHYSRSVSPVSYNVELPQRTELSHLIEAYFNGPHQFCFYSFIHQPSFIQMLNKSRLPMANLLIVIAIGLYCLDPRNRLSEQWAYKCRHLVMMDIFSLPSITKLQALLLLHRFDWYVGSHITTWVISALAVRLAHLLRLNIENQPVQASGNWITTQETRRRIMWSCVVMESMKEGAGLNPLSCLDASVVEVKLPCDERCYQLDLPAESQYLHSASDATDVQSLAAGMPLRLPQLEISAWNLKLLGLRVQITKYTGLHHPQNKTIPPIDAAWKLDKPFYQFQQELNSWMLSLPPDLQYNVTPFISTALRWLNF